MLSGVSHMRKCVRVCVRAYGAYASTRDTRGRERPRARVAVTRRAKCPRINRPWLCARMIRTT